MSHVARYQPTVLMLLASALIGATITIGADTSNPQQRRPGLFGRRPDAPATPTAKNDGAPATSDEIAFFEKKIRPVLVQNCYECHAANAKKIKGNFLLDTRAGIRKGGDTGPGVVPGNLDKSLVIAAIRWKDENLQMPPKKKLADDVIADFEKWVKMGAPDPRDGQAVAHSEIDINKGKQFWAFQQPKDSRAAGSQRLGLAEE